MRVVKIATPTYISYKFYHNLQQSQWCIFKKTIYNFQNLELSFAKRYPKGVNAMGHERPLPDNNIKR